MKVLVLVALWFGGTFYFKNYFKIFSFGFILILKIIRGQLLPEKMRFENT